MPIRFATSFIAGQSVFARLVIQEKTSELSRFQEATQNFIRYYDNGSTADRQPITKVSPYIYSITNLPATISSLPRHSIFSYIGVLDPRSPDLRFVPVANSDSYYDSNDPAGGESLKQTYDVVETGIVDERKSVKDMGRSIFEDNPPELLMDESFPWSDSNDVEELIRLLGRDPMRINLSDAMKLVPSYVWKRYKKNLEHSKFRDNNITTAQVIKEVFSRLSGVNESTMAAVANNESLPMNEETAKVGIAHVLIANIPTKLLNRMSMDQCLTLAEMVNGAVSGHIKSIDNTNSVDLGASNVAAAAAQSKG